jgi:hypothetical protein
MTNKSRICVIATGLALLVAIPLSAAPKKPKAPKLVPFKGKLTAVVTSEEVTVTNPDMTTTTTTEETLEGVGNGTHLGRFAVEGETTSTDDAEAAGGTMTFIAANGDEVWATVTGESVIGSDGLVDTEIEGTIVGGTGRFDTSTGYFTMYITTDPVTNAAKATYNGKISGPGKGN